VHHLTCICVCRSRPGALAAGSTILVQAPGEGSVRVCRGRPDRSLTRRSFTALVRRARARGPGGTVLRGIAEGKAAEQHAALHTGITGPVEHPLAATIHLVWTSPATAHYPYLRPSSMKSLLLHLSINTVFTAEAQRTQRNSLMKTNQGSPDLSSCRTCVPSSCCMISLDSGIRRDGSNEVNQRVLKLCVLCVSAVINFLMDGRYCRSWLACMEVGEPASARIGTAQARDHRDSISACCASSCSQAASHSSSRVSLSRSTSDFSRSSEFNSALFSGW
jgi:hypothetical protein